MIILAVLDITPTVWALLHSRLTMTVNSDCYSSNNSLPHISRVVYSQTFLLKTLLTLMFCKRAY